MKDECFRPLSRGPFFNLLNNTLDNSGYKFSSPFSGIFFSIRLDRQGNQETDRDVFVPFLGNFFQWHGDHYPSQKAGRFRPLSWKLFSIACLQSPSPSALASAFAAGMGGSLHQALSFGDEMPIFPVRTGIGGDLQ